MNRFINREETLSALEAMPLLDRFLQLLRQSLGDRLLAMALYGSVARGQAGPTSDVDLLIIYRGDRQEIFGLFMEAARALEKTAQYQALRQQGFMPDPFPVFFSEDRLADTPWLLLDVQDHGIILYDPQQILAHKFEALQQRLKELGSRKVVLEDGTWYWDLKPDWKPGEVIVL